MNAETRKRNTNSGSGGGSIDVNVLANILNDIKNTLTDLLDINLDIAADVNTCCETVLLCDVVCNERLIPLDFSSKPPHIFKSTGVAYLHYEINFYNTTLTTALYNVINGSDDNTVIKFQLFENGNVVTVFLLNKFIKNLQLHNTSGANFLTFDYVFNPITETKPLCISTAMWVNLGQNAINANEILSVDFYFYTKTVNRFYRRFLWNKDDGTTIAPSPFDTDINGNPYTVLGEVLDCNDLCDCNDDSSSDLIDLLQSIKDNTGVCCHIIEMCDDVPDTKTVDIQVKHVGTACSIGAQTFLFEISNNGTSDFNGDIAINTPMATSPDFVFTIINGAGSLDANIMPTKWTGVLNVGDKIVLQAQQPSPRSGLDCDNFMGTSFEATINSAGFTDPYLINNIDTTNSNCFPSGFSAQFKHISVDRVNLIAKLIVTPQFIGLSNTVVSYFWQVLPASAYNLPGGAFSSTINGSNTSQVLDINLGSSTDDLIAECTLIDNLGNRALVTAYIATHKTGTYQGEIALGIGASISMVGNNLTVNADINMPIATVNFATDLQFNDNKLVIDTPTQVIYSSTGLSFNHTFTNLGFTQNLLIIGDNSLPLTFPGGFLASGFAINTPC